MKIMTWNVNGIRASLKHGFAEKLQAENPDIICLQEMKARPEQVDFMPEGYHIYWHAAEKPGYAGTAIFSKKKPLKEIYKMDIAEHDTEGRLVILEYKSFILVNVYVPNAQRGLARLSYREQWDKDFLAFLKKLEKKKPLIICGDLNVAHKEIDLKNPKSNKTTATRPGNAGFTDEERAGFDAFLDAGFVDIFRLRYPDKEQYTWWSYMFNARKKNVGWRIDYFLVSSVLEKKVKDVIIRNDIMGSDHCPVELQL